MCTLYDLTDACAMNFVMLSLCYELHTICTFGENKDFIADRVTA
jgi:hypothetical protein